MTEQLHFHSILIMSDALFIPSEEPRALAAIIFVQPKELPLLRDMCTDSKSGKEFVKAVYCHPAYLTYIRVHHEKCQAG